ncbi:MAG: hypothetical protein B6243_08735 [Anaerolineaceae bacterium 4572_5.2]|nr:MAG: hypothetical protein B6243_08735 [Anaerolineaceae bacterium 4572_5.2]
MNKSRLTLLTTLILISCASCGVVDLLPFRATLTPTPTTSPTATVQPSPTVQPTPTAVTPPTESTLAGDVAFFYGDWDSALDLYLQTIENSPSPTEESGALLGLGKVYNQLEQYPQALDVLRRLLIAYPDSAHTAEAQFELAQTYTALDRHLEAASAYEAYLERNPGVIDSYIQEWRGDAYAAAGQHLASIEAYQSAIAAGGGDVHGTQMKIGLAYAALGEHLTAVIVYQDIYDNTSNDYLKARADYLLGQSFSALENPTQAQAAYLDAVENYPLSYDAYLSLLELVNADYPVNDLDRGLVNYFAGKYALAIDAFDRYLSQPLPEPVEGETPEYNFGTALYYKGFALQRSGNSEAALLAWSELIENYPEDDYWDEAWEFKAYTEWAYLSLYAQGVQTLVDFVNDNPLHYRAAEFLFDAARVEEYAQNYTEAIALWERVAIEYASSDYALKSIFLALNPFF